MYLLDVTYTQEQEADSLSSRHGIIEHYDSGRWVDMPMPTIEERLSVIEKELAHIKQQLTIDKPLSSPHPWDKVFGSFANSEGFEEAVQLGREYRESLRPNDDEDAS